MNTVTTKADRGDEPVPEHEHPADRAGLPAKQDGALQPRSARERIEALLDEALGETFPASDPIAITSRKLGAT